MWSQEQTKNQKPLQPLSEIANPRNHNSEFVSYDKLTDRRSARSHSENKNLASKVTETTQNSSQMIKSLEKKVLQLQKQLELLYLKINQLSKDSQEVNQTQKLSSLQRKCQKMEYIVWETKQLEKQNRTANQDLSNQIFEHKQSTEGSLKSLKSDNKFFIQGIQDVIKQLLCKIQTNKRDFSHKLKDLCDTMQSICVIRSIENTAVKQIRPLTVPLSTIYNSKNNDLKERASLPANNPKLINSKKSSSCNKKNLRKQVNSFY